MISAYFDDSGTHERSDIVLVAGIFGTEARMNCLDRNWKQLLDSPLDGFKEKLGRFHAYDCFQSIGEFTGWTRTETDYFRHQLRTVIVEADVAAYGVACSRKDYDELIKGDMREVLGTPEGYCINQCFVRSLRWVQENTFDPQMTMIFDNRPSPVKRYAGTVYDAFARWVIPPPNLAGYAFLNSKDVRPLQAADMLAWELYQHANAMLINGVISPHKELKHLNDNMTFIAQLATRESIIKIRGFWEEAFRERPHHLKQVADHFSSFDPQNPDYSKLYD